MSKTDIAEFSMDDFAAADVAEMTVEVNGRPTTWVWSFAGPGHEKAIAQANRLSRERLHEDRLKEQAVTNGRKWKADELTVDEVRERNVNQIVERIVGWSPVRIDGKDFPFTPENAKALLSDPKRVGLFTQALSFLSDDQSFTTRSAIG